MTGHGSALIFSVKREKSRDKYRIITNAEIVFCITRDVKQDFLSNVPAADSRPNYFGISPSPS